MMITKSGKLRRVLSLISLLVLFSLVLTSCTLPTVPSAKIASVTIDDFMVKIENQGGAGQTVTQMSAMSGIPVDVSGDVILTEERVTDETSGEDIVIFRFYNLSDGKLLMTENDGDALGFVSNSLEIPENAAGIFYVIRNDVLHIYNSDGSIAVSSYFGKDTTEDEDGTASDGDAFDAVMPEITDTLNGFAFNGVEYYVKEGFVVYEGDRPLESGYFNASVAYNDRYYYIDEELVFVFGEQGNLLYEYHLPSYALNSHIYVLGDGNVFIQYTYLAIEGEEHDFVWGGEKHKIVSILANTEKGTESNPILSFLVTDLHNAFTDEDFYDRYTERVSNLAKIMEINNNRVDDNTPAHYAVLSNSLLKLFSLFDVARGALDITRVSYDRNLVTTAAGNMLVAGNGQVIGQLNNFRCITETYILTSGKIYDHDLREIFDLTKEGYTYFDTVGNNIILSKVVDDSASLYLFSGGEPVYISAAADYRSCFEGYVVMEDDVCLYYDGEGNQIARTSNEINWIYEREIDGLSTHVGYAIDADGDVNYYRLQFAPLSTIQ